MKAVKIQNSDECSPLLRTALQPSRKLCRSLFGPIDHEQVKEDLQKELEKDLKAKCELWCFDFFSGRPSPDKNTRFNWEAIRGLPSRPISPKTSSLPKDELRQFSVAESEEKLSPSHEKHPVQLNTSLSSALQSSKSSSDSTTNDDSSTMKRKRKHQQAAITGNWKCYLELYLLLIISY